MFLGSKIRNALRRPLYKPYTFLHGLASVTRPTATRTKSAILPIPAASSRSIRFLPILLSLETSFQSFYPQCTARGAKATAVTSMYHDLRYTVLTRFAPRPACLRRMWGYPTAFFLFPRRAGSSDGLYTLGPETSSHFWIIRGWGEAGGRLGEVMGDGRRSACMSLPTAQRRQRGSYKAPDHLKKYP